MEEEYIKEFNRKLREIKIIDLFNDNIKNELIKTKNLLIKIFLILTGKKIRNHK